MKIPITFFSLVLFANLLLPLTAHPETIPAPPTKYFDDRMGAISAQDAENFNTKLEALEKNTPGNPQFVISVLKFDTDSSLEDYCNRIAKSWKVGQKDKNNGVILFWFPETRKLRFEVGYGLEGFLTDAGTKRILSSVVVPAFKSKNYAKGLEGAIDAVEKKLVSAGEEVATTPSGPSQEASLTVLMVMVGIVIFVILPAILTCISRSRRREAQRQARLIQEDREWALRRASRLLHKPIQAKTAKISRTSPIIPMAAVAASARKKPASTPKKKETRRSSDSDSGSIFGGSSFGGSDSGSSSFGGGGGDFGGGGAGDSY